MSEPQDARRKRPLSAEEKYQVWQQLLTGELTQREAAEQWGCRCDDDQPIFAHGGAKLEDVLGAFQAGESLDALAQEYGVPVTELEDALRVASRLAA